MSREPKVFCFVTFESGGIDSIHLADWNITVFKDKLMSQVDLIATRDPQRIQCDAAKILREGASETVSCSPLYYSEFSRG